jgi:hypothetical protein
VNANVDVKPASANNVTKPANAGRLTVGDTCPECDYYKIERHCQGCRRIVCPMCDD